ncbi:MAG: hypothetical protein GF334_12770 [Candidatus Altiarchaeales archaeon]|nr:hypothetical protein [Candidatus Altiarchaeales archaeon]
MIEKLDKSKSKKILGDINTHFQSDYEPTGTLLSKKKGDTLKIFLYSGDYLPESLLHWVGVHIASFNGYLRLLSVEGAQAVAKTADRNVVEVSKKQVEQVMAGRDIEVDGMYEGCVILRRGPDVVGVGTAENKKIVNEIATSRRLIRYPKRD